MSTSFGEIQDTTLQKLCDAVAASINRPDGTKYPAAPNAFVDRMGDTLPNGSAVVDPNGEVTIVIKVQRNSAHARVVSHSRIGVNSLQGDVDVATLATKLV